MIGWQRDETTRIPQLTGTKPVWKPTSAVRWINIDDKMMEAWVGDGKDSLRICKIYKWTDYSTYSHKTRTGWRMESALAKDYYCFNEDKHELYKLLNQQLDRFFKLGVRRKPLVDLLCGIRDVYENVTR